MMRVNVMVIFLVMATLVSGKDMTPRSDTSFIQFGKLLRSLYAQNLQDGGSASSAAAAADDAFQDMPNEILQHKDLPAMVYVPMLKKRSQFLCGRRLTSTLDALCGGLFNTRFPKRNFQADDNSIDEDLPHETFFKHLLESDSESDSGHESESQSESESWPFIAKEKAHQVFNPEDDSFHRMRRGAYDECCLKSCTYSEIMKYCAPRNGK